MGNIAFQPATDFSAHPLHFTHEFFLCKAELACESFMLNSYK